MRPLPVLLVLVLLAPAVPVSAEDSPYRVTLRAPAISEAGKPFTVEGHVNFWSIPAAPATIEFYIDGKRVAGYLLPLPWFKVTLTLPAERGEHTVHAVLWSSVDGFRAQSAPVTVMAAVRPGAPLDVSAAPVPDAHAMSVSWLAPADDGDAPLQSYRVYRAPQGSTAWSLRATVKADTTSLEETVMPETTYRYRVVAVNSIGDGAASAYVEKTSGPRLAADAIGYTQVRFRVCWSYDDQRDCEIAAANSTVYYPTSTAWVEPIISGKSYRAGEPLPFDIVNGSYFWGWDHCPPGDLCAPYMEESATLSTTAAENGFFVLRGSSWSHSVWSGTSGCDRFDIDATLTSGTARAEPWAWVDLCH